jgi:hypothetical protein
MDPKSKTDPVEALRCEALFGLRQRYLDPWRFPLCPKCGAGENTVSERKGEIYYDFRCDACGHWEIVSPSDLRLSGDQETFNRRICQVVNSILSRPNIGSEPRSQQNNP